MKWPPVVLSELAAKQPRSRIRLRCRPCGRTAYFVTRDVAAVLPAGVTYEALKGHVTCKGCGRPVDDDLVQFDLDLEPLSQEEAIARMWGGFGPNGHLPPPQVS